MEGGGGFPGDDGLLAGGAPAVVSDGAGGSDDSMAGNDVSKRVVADGGSYGARGGRLADGFGQTSVADEGSGGDVEEGTPDADLEGTAANEGAQMSRLVAVEWSGEKLWGEVFSGCVVPPDVCARPVSVDGGFGFGAVRCVNEGEVADAPGTLRDEAWSEGAVGESGADRPIGAGGFDLARRSGFESDAEVVEAARSRQAGFE